MSSAVIAREVAARHIDDPVPLGRTAAVGIDPLRASVARSVAGLAGPSQNSLSDSAIARE